ncbi:MAG: L-histidine N(alpha)-methyltransferase [Gemmatimonadota bacterium]|nr:L-histidine N(alpha)-methyltransferase [Gemmatimonadota bacterium]
MTDDTGTNVTTSNDERTHAEELAIVLNGLRRPVKRIATKYHYDEHGSRLFEQITELDEYYLTRTERALLERWMPAWVADLEPRTLVELGAGSAEKSRIILDAMVSAGCGEAYVPVDVSADFLGKTTDTLRAEYPGLEIVPEVADIKEPLDLVIGLPHPRWVAFLGSTLGNFDGVEASRLLGRIAARLHDGDRFLLGVDLRPGPKKSIERVEAAYNDPKGVTQRFSLNILAVVNHEFGSDFDLDRFVHRSRYNVAEGRIETELVSLTNQVVHFPGDHRIVLQKGEPIRTEISSKYDRTTIDGLFEGAGLVVDRWIEDDEGLYALVLSGPAA